MKDYVKKLHDESVRLAHGLRFDKDLRADGMVVAYYMRLIELAGGIATLMDSPCKSSAGIVFRTFLETYVDMTNLLNDRDYVNNIAAAHHQKWVRVINNSTTGNPFLSSIGSTEDVSKAKAEHEAKLEELKKKGFKPLHALDKFAKADMEEVYRSIYTFSSGATHSDFGAIIEHHLEKDGDDFRLVAYKDFDDNFFEAQWDRVASLLVEATARIHDRLKSTCGDEIKALQSELAELRKQGVAGGSDV
ncbi:MAG: DUF5677 domain-containing protein [Hyphomicrobiaceae bacterium]